MAIQYRTTMKSPVGTLYLAGDDQTLMELLFSKKQKEGKEDDRPFREAIRQLEAYFAGERKRFDLRLEPEGTPFQKSVWMALRGIPYGRTESYGELAQRIGNPRACRAVGAANGKNPISIIVPCHRVIGGNGTLTGFGGGLDVKEKLLRLEGAWPRP